MTASDEKSGQSQIPQAVVQPLTRAAIFLIVTINPGVENRSAVRSFCGDLSALVRAVGFRDLEENLSCVLGFGSDAWDKLFGTPRPAELHPFREIHAGPRRAIGTPGDLLLHIRAKRMDLCFELATQIMARLGNAVLPVDEVHGFRYFDDRDLIGFVDGTENPTDQAAIDAALVSVYFFTGCGLSLFVALLTASMKQPEDIPMEELFKHRQTALLFVAMAVLVAPLVEETLFRGYLYPLFARSFGIAPGILLTGILFGLMHGAQLGWTWSLVSLLILVGIIFTLVRARTGSVFASFLMHLGYNSLIAVVAVLSTHGFTKIPTGQ